MRTALALLMMLYARTAEPEMVHTEWWQPWMLGRPCSLKIDIEEGTCRLEVKTKPEWSHHRSKTDLSTKGDRR